MNNVNSSLSWDTMLRWLHLNPVDGRRAAENARS
jgi:hypothetical protein